VEFEHDLLGRVVARGEDSDTIEGIDLDRRETTAYDARGLETSMTTARGHVISYTYDAAGQTTGTTYGSTSISHVLDENGNRVLSVIDGAPVSRSFDALDRLTSRTDEFGNRVDAVRDLAGRLRELIYPSDLNGDSERDKVLYGYDDLHRLTSVEDWDGNRTTYDYDRLGRPIRTTLPDGSAITTSWDDAGRLVGISDPGGDFNASYRLNAAGVPTSASLSLPLDPVISTDDTTYLYGSRNELESSSAGADFAYDNSGNMTSGTIGGVSVSLLHNEVHELTSIGAANYRYDMDGLRIETDRSGTVRRYVYDIFSGAPRLLEEHDESGNVVSRYVHGLGLISRDGSEGFRVYHFDSRGSTVSLTDGTGTITDRYAYDPFGRPAGHAGATLQPFRYNGRDGVFDDDNGLYFMSTRYYAYELQRFIEIDHGYEGDLSDPQSLNRSAFGRGNPIQVVDPDGEWGFWAPIAIIGSTALSVGVECWDGCSKSELAGAAVDGLVAGVFLAVNPLGSGAVALGATAGLAGAAVGLATQAGVAELVGEEGPSGTDVAVGLIGGAVGGAIGGKLGSLGAREAVNVGGKQLVRQGATRALGSATRTAFSRGFTRTAVKNALRGGLKKGTKKLFMEGVDQAKDSGVSFLGDLFKDDPPNPNPYFKTDRDVVNPLFDKWSPE